MNTKRKEPEHFDGSERYQKAISLIDAANAEDPNLEYEDGMSYPKEILYAERMTICLKTFAPNASEALWLAARSQHLERWQIPRSRYPMDRKGYLQWRARLKSYHAERAGILLKRAGYDDVFIKRVQDLLQKSKLKSDPETQIIEDLACLVFMEFYLNDFAMVQEEKKVITILRKTLKKMSQKAIEEVKTFAWGPPMDAIIQKIIPEST